MTDKILSNLNPQQLKAVLTTEGYVRVIAGAGSGKTRALTSRYAYLVEELGVSPSNILCITFTNKAAREMKLRLRRMLGDGIDTSFVSTLHSFCTRVLREDIGRLFYPEGFVVLDNADQKNILEEVYEELGIKMDTATFEFMIDKIRYEKNLLSYMDYMADPSRDIATVDTPTTELKVIYRYMEKQKKYFGLDFFDLINFTIYLFDHYADVLLKWQKRLHYVMVDEFQDITAKEFKQIRRLVAVNKNWFVVGDPDQNIYEWRGSNMQVLLGFDKPQDTPSSLGGMIPCETIFLNENYRSTPEILNASNSLIAKNLNRIEKALYTKNQNGMPVAHYHGKNDADEIKFIVGKIEAHVKNGGRYSDCAVIYRSSFVSRFVEQGFIKYEIPYTVYGGVGFYERKEIKDVLSYLRLAAYGDDLSFKRVVNTPRRRMGKNKMAYLTARATAEKSTLYKTLKRHLDAPVFANSGARRFIRVIEDAKAESETTQVSELLQRLLIDSGYEAYVRESGEMERLDNVAELIRYIVTLEGEYGEPLSLTSFLQEASLGRDADDDRSDYVRIMTAHTAKGLEFHTVFIAGMSEKTFPSARALEERREDALEEERRLAYVAMTRAKKQLFISESEGFGFRGYSRTPSRFLFDIDDAYITRIGSISDEVLAEHKAQTIIRTPNAANVWPAGTHVKHKAFGEGVIEEADALTQTYMVRFLNGIKPIRFGYQGMAEV